MRVQHGAGHVARQSRSTRQGSAPRRGVMEGRQASLRHTDYAAWINNLLLGATLVTQTIPENMYNNQNIARFREIASFTGAKACDTPVFIRYLLSPKVIGIETVRREARSCGTKKGRNLLFLAARETKKKGFRHRFHFTG